MRSPLLPRVAQASYLTWGYLQEKVVTTELPHPHPHPHPDPSTLSLTRVPNLLEYPTPSGRAVQVMTTEYETGRFPSAAFCVFSNRVCAIVAAPHPNPKPQP